MAEQIKRAILTSSAIGDAETGPLPCRALHRRDNFWMGMAQNGRPPSSDIIHVLIAIHVEDMRSLRALGKKRLAAHGAEGPHRRIHAARDVAQRLGEQFFGFGSQKHPAANTKLMANAILWPYADVIGIPGETPGEPAVPKVFGATLRNAAVPGWQDGASIQPQAVEFGGIRREHVHLV